MHVVIAAAIGFAAGCACPGVVRKAREYFFGEVAKVEADAKSAASAVQKKL